MAPADPENASGFKTYKPSKLSSANLQSERYSPAIADVA
jgi:hypothetical protein